MSESEASHSKYVRRPSVIIPSSTSNSSSFRERTGSESGDESLKFREFGFAHEPPQLEFQGNSHFLTAGFGKKKSNEANIPEKGQSDQDSLSKALAKEYPGFRSSSLENILHDETSNEYLELMYITCVYIRNNRFGARDPSSEEPPKLLAAINQLIPLSSNAKYEYLTKKAKLIKSPEFVLNVKIVEAADLIPADPNGLSDPFCRLWMNNSKSDTKETSIKDHTLHPSWNESFCLRMKNRNEDVLHIQIWDKDPRGIRANLIELRNVRGLRGFWLFCRECSQNLCSCRSGSIDDFLGKVDVFVNNINSEGFDDFVDLKDMKENSIAGQLHFSAEFQVLRPKRISDALKRHLLLFKICLKRSRRQNGNLKIIVNNWEQILPTASLTLLFQHRVQSGLTQAEDLLCRFIVFVHLTQKMYSFDFKFVYNIIDETYESMQQLMSKDFSLENDFEDLYRRAVYITYDGCNSIISALHSVDLTDEKKCVEFEYVLRCIRVCCEISETNFPWETLRLEAINWFEQAAEEVHGVDSKIKTHFINKIINFIIAFHTAADKVVTKVFPDRSYTDLTCNALDSALSESFKSHIAIISEESTKFIGDAKLRKIKDALGIFIKIKELGEYVCKVVGVSHPSLKVSNFRDWFGSSTIEEWFKYKQELIARKIKHVISNDNLVVSSAGRADKHSLSVKSTINVIQNELVFLWSQVSHPNYPQLDCIFLESLHFSCMKYAEYLLSRIHSKKIESSFRSAGKKKLCVIANNLWFLAMCVKTIIAKTVTNVPTNCHDTKFCLKLTCYIICTDISKAVESDIVDEIKKVVSAGSKKKQTRAITAYVKMIHHLVKVEAMDFMAFEVYLVFLIETLRSVINAIKFFKNVHLNSGTRNSFKEFFVTMPNVFEGLRAILTETEKLCFKDSEGKLKEFMCSEDFSLLKRELQQEAVHR